MNAFLDANRDNWDDRTAVHLTSELYDVAGQLAAAAGPRPREVEALGDVTGLRLLHLQCHVGLDTLAWARAGAIVTGLDFSPAAIDAARELAARAGLVDHATFVCADVHDAVAALDHATFDIVYTSLGVLCWLPSVERWAEQVGDLVAPGGRFYMHNGHPFAWAMDEDDLRPAYTYFEEAEPQRDDAGTTYTDGNVASVLEHATSYEWNHSLGEIVTALIGHGLRIRSLVEHDWTMFQARPFIVQSEDGTWSTPPSLPRVPLSFTLVATRPPLPPPAGTATAR